MQRTNAFTLIELLVAIALVAVLAVLLSMGVNKVSSATKSAKCIVNLRTIGTAALSFGYEHDGYLLPHSTYSFWETSGSERIRKAKWHWMTHLSPYLGSPDATGPMSPVFNCPSDPEVPNWPVNRPWVPASAGDKSNTLSSYGYNYYYLTTANSWWSPDKNTADHPRNLKAITRPGKTILFADRRDFVTVTDPDIRPAVGRFPSLIHSGRFNAVFLDGHVKSLDADALKKPVPLFEPE